jgi:hypothetical protein
MGTGATEWNENHSAKDGRPAGQKLRRMRASVPIHCIYISKFCIFIRLPRKIIRISISDIMQKPRALSNSGGKLQFLTFWKAVLSCLLGAVYCIIQSSKTGEIIVTSWDGSVKLFKKPNLDILIFNNWRIFILQKQTNKIYACK